jgi:hypothetical protein
MLTLVLSADNLTDALPHVKEVFDTATIEGNFIIVTVPGDDVEGDEADEVLDAAHDLADMGIVVDDIFA